MLEELLQLRYPQLLFLLNTHAKQEKKIQESDALAVKEFAFKVIKQTPALILLVGLSSIEYFLSIKLWLKTHPQTELLIFEEDLDVIAHFLTNSHAKILLDHPQVHLRYILKHADLIQALKEAVKEYPVENILIEITQQYKERYSLEELSLSVLRRATITSSLFNEDAYCHLLFRNLLSNFHLLPSCFYADCLRDQFKDIPAVICGAGPSLEMHIPLLKQMENKALIIAGGSTLAALSTQGVNPHIGLALDPNPEEYDRLKVNQSFEVPLLFGSRVMPFVFRTCNGPTGYMRTFSGGLVEQALEEKLELEKEPLLTGISQEGLSVTVMSFAAAVHFGCNPIFISGVDLAYVDKKRYADGIMEDSSVVLEDLQKNQKVSDRLFCKKNRSGEEVYTTVKWIMEAATIEEFAKEHSQVRVYDSVEKGLGFPALAKMSLAEAMEMRLYKEYDLRNYVHASLQEVPHFLSKKEDIEGFINELKRSFEECHILVKKILRLLEEIPNGTDPQENGFMTLYTMDLADQRAFEYFLFPVEELITPILAKEFRLSSVYAQEMKKYQHFDRLIEHYLSLLKHSV